MSSSDGHCDAAGGGSYSLSELFGGRGQITSEKRKSGPARPGLAPRGGGRASPLGSKGAPPEPAAGRGSRDSRVSRVARGYPGPVGETARFLADYVALPDASLVVVSAWVAAAWLADLWDRFPHLAVTSSEKRCGKSTLLDLLSLVVPRPRLTTNISPAALYRVIEAEKPTLLMDESQSIARRGSEATEVIREILNAGIGKNARVTRCGGERFDQVQEFSVYSPKVFALIGGLDGVLADRSLPVEMRRKTAADAVQRYRSRAVEPRGRELGAGLGAWAAGVGEEITGVYDRLEPFAIENDRMAELLLPLQAVLTVACPGALGVLRGYARGLDERDREQETQSPGVRLLAACRDVFERCRAETGITALFVPTTTLIEQLVARAEEPWGRYTRGEAITPEALANLLRPYGIRSRRNNDQSARGYVSRDFEEAWGRYLGSTLKRPANSANPASGGKEGGQ